MTSDAILDTVQIPGQPEASEAPATPKEKREHAVLKEQKAAFNALLEQQKAERKAQRVRKAEKEASAVEVEPAKAQAAPEASAPAKAAEPKKSSSEVEKLRAKLQLAGAPRSAIETLSDEEVREWWKGQEDRERNTALALQRASEAEKEISRLKETAGKAEQVPTAEPDLGDIEASLADKFGEDEAGALLQALKGLVSPLQKELQETRQILAQARENGLKDISSKNRSRLAAKLPMLGENEKAWDAIHAQALERSKKDPSRYSSADAVYDEVFNDLYLPLLEAMQTKATPAPLEKASEEKARVQASALTPPGSLKREKRVTPMDAAYAAFKVLKKNPEDLDGARRAYGQATVPQ